MLGLGDRHRGRQDAGPVSAITNLGVAIPRFNVYYVCMARRNISLPDDLDDLARKARLNVSALTQRAVVQELDRQARMVQLDMWLDELDADQGVPSPNAMAAARHWFASARNVQSRDLARQPSRSKKPKAQRTPR